MSREEDAIRATTRAIAATVREVPPLQFEQAPDESRSPGRGPRRRRPRWDGPRLRSWLTPVAAAAVVVAVAIALVLVRGNPNGGVVHPSPPVTAGPGGVPRYYVALNPVTVNHVGGYGLLVGDTLTGQTLADIAPPAQMSYASVTAAADDRTFLAFATNTRGSGNNGRWYILHLAPGTQNEVELSSTALGPQTGVVASALSGSGKYLAVAENGPPRGQQRVIVFSVATGRPLRTWSTKNAPTLWSQYTTQQNLLTWIDDDRAIAFSDFVAPGVQTLRRLNVGGPPGADDLIADSQLIWSATANTGPLCRLIPPLVSADGHTIACVTTGAKRLQLTITWRGYRASAQAPAAGQYTTAYQFTQPVPGSTTFLAGTLWVSPSGSALIGQWAINPSLRATPSPSGSGGSSASATLQLGGVLAGVHVGVMSHGTFTPLPLPPRILALPVSAIAW
jgi:hypothetical protein